MISDSSVFVRIAKSFLGNENIACQKIVKNAYEILLNEKENIIAFQFLVECFEKGGEVGEKCFEDAIDLTLEKNPELFHALMEFIYKKENNKKLLKAIKLQSEVYLMYLFEKNQEKAFLFLKDFLNNDHEFNRKIAKNVIVNFLKDSKVNIKFLTEYKKQEDSKINDVVIAAFEKFASSGHDEVNELIKNSQKVKELKKYSEIFQEHLIYLVKESEEYLKTNSKKALKNINNCLEENNNGFFKNIASLSFKNLLKDKNSSLIILNSCIERNKKNINLLFMNILKEMILNNEIEEETLNEFKKTCSGKEDNLSKKIMKIISSKSEDVNGNSKKLMGSKEHIIENNTVDNNNNENNNILAIKKN